LRGNAEMTAEDLVCVLRIDHASSSSPASLIFRQSEPLFSV
jgi:hypothetical protein